MENSEFAQLLLNKYDPENRPMPWKGISNPYLIWLSEIILQQTKVKQGWNYYLKFKKRFPHLSDLALAEEDEVLKMWEGLGYYSRARNLHFTAKHILKDLDGQFPRNYTELLKLKGVGPYTAAAIASFAFGEKRAVLDGNVFRVLSRYFGISTAIDSSQGKKEFEALANALIDENSPALYNQAIMDLGAETCKAKNPNCENCPLLESCYAGRTQKTKEFPVKKNKIKKRTRYFNFFLISNKQNETLIRKRGAGDIWQALYELPNIESDVLLENENIFAQGIEAFSIEKIRVQSFKLHSYRTHILTHQKIEAQLFMLKIDKLPILEGYQAISLDKMNNFAFPRLINLLLEI